MSRTVVGRAGAWAALGLMTTAACGAPGTAVDTVTSSTVTSSTVTSSTVTSDGVTGESVTSDPANGDEWACAPHDDGTTSSERCELRLPSGYRVITDAPITARAATPVVVVDPGQPLSPTPADVSAEVRAQLPDAILVTAVPPPVSPVSPGCATADDQGLWEACPVDEMASIYLDDYADAIGHGLARAEPDDGGTGAGYAVVGATFAASRWAWLADAPGFTAPESLTVVSPLHPDTTLNHLRIGLLSSTASIFGAVLEGCEDAACLVNLAPAETCLECDAALTVADAAGTDYETALDGLMGLSASVDDDGPLVARAVRDGDPTALRQVLARGSTFLHGRTDAGDRTTERVHVLSAVCPFLDATPDDDDGWWSECRFDDRDARTAGATATFIGCSYSPQPDPVLGEAPMFGQPAGDGRAPVLATRGVVAHADLGLAADVVARLVAADGEECPAPPDEFAIPAGAPQPFALDDAPFLQPADG